MIIRNRPKRPLNLRKKQDGFLLWPERFRQPSSGIAYKDPYWDKTVLNLKMDGANGSTVFTDTSLSGKTSSVNGNAQISTTQSKFGGASAYFDGSGDYISFASSSDFSLFGGDFTVECWFYPQNTASNQALFEFYSSDTNRWNISLVSNIDWYTIVSGTGSQKIAGTAPTTNAWHHVALVKSGTTFSLYLDGALVGTSTTTSYPTGNMELYIGSGRGGSNYQGYIDDLRITKGAARYVADFIPPVREHPTEWGDQYWNETVLNCNFNTAITDSSISANVLTANGNAVISITQKKYGAGSAYFDGSGDFLSLPASSDFAFGAANFTVEGWVYTATTSGLGAIIGLANGSAANSNYAFQLLRNGSQWQFNVFSGSTAYGSAVGALSINTWYHIAMVRSGNSLYAFVDGALIQTTSITGVTLNAPSGAVAHIGQVQGYHPWNGYIDSLRVTKGVARYTAAFTPPPLAFPEAIADPYAPYTVLHLPFDGANASTVFTDQSWSPKTVTANGNAQISTSQSKFGGASAVFDGSGDYLSIPNSSAFDFGSGDFTISLFVRFATFGPWTGILGKRAGEQNYAPFLIESNGSSQLRFLVSTSGSSWIFIPSSTLTTGIWYHIAAVRRGSTLYYFIDGVSQGTASISGALMTNTNAITIGRDSEAVIGQSQVNGWLDECLITKGIARYTANFTPPRIAHPIS